MSSSSPLLGLLFAAASSSEPAVATPPPRVTEEVLVTAERGAAGRAEVPAAVSVLTREEIEKLPAETLAEVLEFLPGFHASFAHASAGTAPMVSARGFFGGGEAEYVQLRIDGVLVADPESGLADWRRIRASDIERIEALRGPGSSLYGDTAVGGVIEVFTRPARRPARTRGCPLRPEASGLPSRRARRPAAPAAGRAASPDTRLRAAASALIPGETSREWMPRRPGAFPRAHGASLSYPGTRRAVRLGLDWRR